VRPQNERDTIGAPPPMPYVGWIEALAGRYARAEQAGELQAGTDPAVLAHLTIAAFFGLQHLSNTLTERRDLPERFAQFWSVFRPAIAAS
jgi:hypothetical protein